MFHGDRLEMLDKNYNPIWIKTYGGLIFKNILLSKTGSMYFIASSTVSPTSDKIGKIEKNGNFTWGKALSTATVVVGTNTNTVFPFDWNHFFLDRNNDLTLIGNSGYFLKMDTLGNVKKFKFLDYYSANVYTPETSIILNDSAGIYTISTWGLAFEGAYTNLIYKFSDNADSIIKEFNNITYMGVINSGQNIEHNGHVMKSKHSDNAFYLNYCMDGMNGVFPMTFVLEKFNMNLSKRVWRMSILNTSPYLNYFEGLDEDDKKNIFVSMSTYNVNTGTRDKWVWKIDSTWYTSHQQFNTIVNFGKPTAFISDQDSTTKLTPHYGNKYIYSVESSKSNLATLTIEKLDSTLGYACYQPPVIPISTTHYYSTNSWQNPRFKSYTINNALFQNITASTASILNYTVNKTNCITNNIEDILNDNAFTLYPNPANDILTLSSNKNFEIIEISIFDINSKNILTNKNNNSIDVSKLISGIYFLKIKTNQGEFSQKFIKD